MNIVQSSVYADLLKLYINVKKKKTVYSNDNLMKINVWTNIIYKKLIIINNNKNNNLIL